MFEIYLILTTHMEYFFIVLFDSRSSLDNIMDFMMNNVKRAHFAKYARLIIIYFILLLLLY